MHVIERLQRGGLLLSVGSATASVILSAADAIVRAGVTALALPTGTEDLEGVVHSLAERHPDLCVGVRGDSALQGAEFALAPHMDPQVRKACADRGVLLIPECANEEEVMTAASLGCQALQISMPREAAVKSLALLKERNSDLTAILDFSAEDQTFAETLQARKTCVFRTGEICGADMADQARLIQKITALQNRMLGFKMVHIGINCPDSDACEALCGDFQAAFGFQTIRHEASNFASPEAEILKKMFLGKHGHIAVRVNAIPPALHILSCRGFEVDMSTAIYVGERIRTVYLKREFGGFAIHLVERS